MHQTNGRSRGGWTNKVHALTDVIGRPYALMLTAGNVSDIKAAPTHSDPDASVFVGEGRRDKIMRITQLYSVAD